MGENVATISQNRGILCWITPSVPLGIGNSDGSWIWPNKEYPPPKVGKPNFLPWVHFCNPPPQNGTFHGGLCMVYLCVETTTVSEISTSLLAVLKWRRTNRSPMMATRCHYQGSLYNDVSCWRSPCTMRSHARRGCTVRSYVPWVMVTWNPSPNRMADRYVWKHYLSAILLAGGNNSKEKCAKWTMTIIPKFKYKNLNCSFLSRSIPI